MQAYPAIGTFSRSPNGAFANATCLTRGWVNVSNHAAGHGLAAQVFITRAAWMNAVYFVRLPDDRFDPVRENWRMGRLIEEVCCAMSARKCPGVGPSEFTLSLVEGFDRLRSLELPAAQLHVRIEHQHASPEIWVDVACSHGRHRTSPINH